MAPTIPSELEDEVVRFMDAAHPDRSSLRDDPYPFFHRLREAAPVYRAPNGAWLVTSYEATDDLLRQEEWLREEDRPEESYTVAERVFRRSIAFRDPPVHTRLRGIAAPMFTPRALADLRNRATAMARELLENRRDESTFDFRQFAYRLPILVISDMLDLPVDEVTNFDSWAKTMLRLTEHANPSAEILDQADAAASTALDVFKDVTAQRLEEPGDDIISRLTAPDPRTGRTLSLEEVVSMCVLLHTAGHATTTDLFTSGMFHLLQSPQSLQALRRDPGLVPSAVEEFLRYEPPVIVALPRIAPHAMQLGDQTIETGDRVFSILGAANRDPEQFPDPDRFDVTRQDNKNVTFARGIHFCLGAHLARLEVQVALELLVTEFPDLELAVAPDDVEWVDSFIHRGTVALPVAWSS